MSASPQQKLFRSKQDKKRVSGAKSMTKKPKSKPVVPRSQLLRDEGVRGVDVRSPSVATPSQRYEKSTVTGTVPTTKVSATVTDRSVSYLAMGIVLRAIKQGMISQVITNATGAPYYCFRYLIDAFKNAMQGTIPAIQQAPMWFWVLVHAIKKKNGTCKTGYVSYEWIIEDTGLGDDQVFSLGVGEDSYSVFWGTSLSGSTVNGFPVLAPIPPYTQALGESAISALFDQFSAIGMGRQIADPGTSVCTERDTSAFCVVYPELGNSYESPGALRSTYYSERQVDSPLFAKFAIYQPPSTPNWRGWNKAGTTAGTTCYIGPRLCEISNLNDIRNKTPPNFKFYNFDEFFEQLSLTMCLASESYSRFSTPVAPCPLTSLQVQILLRQSLLKHFDNDMAQDLRFSGAIYKDMLPFVVGPNGASTGEVTMLLPTFLAESIRCCARVTSNLGPRNVLDLIPILGRPSPLNQGQLTNYTYDTAQQPGNLLYFVDPAEAPINLIDCSSTLAGNTVYLDVSRTTLHTLSAVWNEWISNFTAVLSPLVNTGSETGIKALSSLVYTNHSQESAPVPAAPVPVLIAGKAMERKSSAHVIRREGSDVSKFRLGVSVSPVPGNDYFANSTDKETTAVLSFEPSLWNYLGKFVLPVAFSRAQVNDASTQGWQTFEAEMYKLPRSNAGGVGGQLLDPFEWPNVYQRHLNAATIDVKAFASTAQQNEFIEGLIEMGKQGRGGFFTNIAGMIGEGLGIKGSRAFAKSIGDLTGL